MMIRRRLNPSDDDECSNDDASGNRKVDYVAIFKRNNHKANERKLVLVVVAVIGAFMAAVSSGASHVDVVEQAQRAFDHVKSKKILKTFNVSKLCDVTNTTTSPASKVGYYECGQTRLLREYGLQISLDAIEFNPNSGEGNVTAVMCQSHCFERFNASDLLIWVRLTSPAFVFAATAQAIDCRSWRAKFRIPEVLLSSQGQLYAEYRVDVMTLWLNGDPKKYWIADPQRGTKRGKVWNGTRYSTKGGAQMHGELARDNRWMSCSDWCLLHPKCTHWSYYKSELPRFVTSNPKRCKMFSNVTGLFEDKGAQSGFFSPDEHRVTYLGGLSIDTNDVDRKKLCRKMAHVLGSPFVLEIPYLRASNGNSKDTLSQLPWCSAHKSKESTNYEGFWAQASEVYPTAIDKNCPEACTKNCTHSDSLQGICAFNDVSPTGSWRKHALKTAEPPLKELAWVERYCRYRLGTGDLFKNCLKDHQFDLIIVPENDIFGELLDRWHLGRFNQWSLKSWKSGFVYRIGEDWLIPNKGSPAQLRPFWKNLTNNGRVPLKAVVVQHVWPNIGPTLLYTNNGFGASKFEKPIKKHIEAWQESLSSDDQWLSKETKFIAILSPLIHEFSGDPYYTYEAIEHYNAMARSLYTDAGWLIIDGMAMSRARPDYRMAMSLWNQQQYSEAKFSGSGVVYAMANAIFNAVCNL